MTSRVIRPGHSRATDSHQLTLNFDGAVHEQHGSLRECIAQGIYRRGLSNVAPSLEEAPGNLSVQLSDNPVRKFSVDSLEQYIEKFGDFQPIYYLVSKFLRQSEPEEPAKKYGPEVLAMAEQLIAMQRRGVRA